MLAQKDYIVKLFSVLVHTKFCHWNCRATGFVCLKNIPPFPICETAALIHLFIFIKHCVLNLFIVKAERGIVYLRDTANTPSLKQWTTVGQRQRRGSCHLHCSDCGYIDVINIDPTVLAFEDFKFQLFWIARKLLEGHAGASLSDLPVEEEAEGMYLAPADINDVLSCCVSRVTK